MEKRAALVAAIIVGSPWIGFSQPVKTNFTDQTDTTSSNLVTVKTNQPPPFAIAEFKQRITGTNETTTTMVVLLADEPLKTNTTSQSVSPLIAYARNQLANSIGFRIVDKDGTSLVAEGQMEFVNLKPLIWIPGAIHVIGGKLKIGSYIFASDDADPLAFQVSTEKGYAYLRGRGTVTTPSGETVMLPHE